MKINMAIIGAKHPFIQLSSQLAELCKPLEAFGIHHFTYLKQYRNGHRISHRVSLSNNPAWIEAYNNLDLYQSSLFEDPKPGSTASFNLWFGDYDLDVYHHGKQYFNTMHSISIVEHQKNSCENYLFSTTPDNPEAIHYLSNNREILYHFIMYLKDRGKAIFKEAEKHKIPVSNERASTSQQYTEWLQNPEWAKEMDSEKEKFFESTTIKSFQLSDIENPEAHFTNRELICIKHLLDYKTATETAALMNLSVRTVEYYLDNIKSKMLCSSRSELIEKLKNSPYLNFAKKK